MKITCNSCGSKYTIADAKVKGKKVKVRCKGCKESILVDGTQLDQDGGAGDDDVDAEDTSDPAATSSPKASPAAAPTTTKKGLWSVNLSDEDSRDMTLEELVAGWKNGTVTSDAYVWKDGMGDWKPILEVGELKLKLGPAPKKGAAVLSSARGPAAGAAVAAAPKSDKMDDLFGGVDTVGSDQSDPGKPAIGGGAGKPTGARNDSSVLFSLDSLTSGGDAPKPGAEVDIFGGMSAGGIGSLGSSNDLLTAPAKDPPPAPAGVRVAPVSAPAAVGGKSKTPIIVAAILGAAILIAGAVFALGGSSDGDADKTSEEVAAAKAEAEAAKKKAEEIAKKAEEEKKKLEAEMKKAKEEAAKKDDGKKDDGKKDDEEKKDEEKKDEEAKTAAAGDTKSGSSSSPSSSKDDEKKDSGSSAPASSGAPPFNVGAAKAALSAAAANSAACGKPGGPTGAGRVQLTFATSGRVASASIVSGPFGGTAVGGCVVSAFRGARVPAFTGTPQTVSKSFKIQ